MRRDVGRGGRAGDETVGVSGGVGTGEGRGGVGDGVPETEAGQPPGVCGVH